MVLQIRKSFWMSSGKCCDDRIALAATGRNSLVSNRCILNPLPSGRTW